MHTSGLILGASVLLAAGASPAQDQDIAACRQKRMATLAARPHAELRKCGACHANDQTSRSFNVTSLAALS